MRRAARRDATRRELLLAGRRIFSREGIYSSRIEDIAHQAGLAKGTAYLYFHSKDELLGEVVREAFEALAAHVRTATAGADGSELPEGIFRAHVGFYAENPDLMRILHQVRGLLKFSRTRGTRLRTHLRTHIEFLASLLGRGAQRGWSAGRRRELALFLFGSVSGMASVRVSAYPEENGLAAMAETWAGPTAEAVRVYAAREEGRRRG